MTAPTSPGVGRGARPRDAHDRAARPRDAHDRDARPRDARDRVARPRDARGSGSLLIIAVLVAIAVATAALVVIGRYVVADHRAGAAADQAAWSGAAAHVRGEDPCAAAADTARRNGARLDDCSVAGDAVDFVISVEVGVSVADAPPGLPDLMPAAAHAGRMG